MAINVNNLEADALTREFAEMAGVSITEAIVIAMREAIERRASAETPLPDRGTPAAEIWDCVIRREPQTSASESVRRYVG